MRGSDEKIDEAEAVSPPEEKRASVPVCRLGGEPQRGSCTPSNQSREYSIGVWPRAVQVCSENALPERRSSAGLPRGRIIAPQSSELFVPGCPDPGTNTDTGMVVRRVSHFRVLSSFADLSIKRPAIFRHSN